ncbi:hypothetical protein [Pseudomonas sp. TMW22091]|uniref:hypothetical protein n=1 Tax=Pseudomonas sp. TMW22091 TaxID=2506435 RepID=UPI001F102262|nr:hypothetical protein [Pseudomonas sp. TMW22091]MCH4873352.1 hypothetical protein [Pseudomonas sp. TMW22091]
MAVEDALQGPVIPLLINNTVDPQALNGGPLLTYAKYDNPQLGDELYQSWLGVTENGDPVDYPGIPIPIDPDHEYELGFVMPVSNHVLMSLDKGQVFYSYYLQRVTDDPDEPKVESKRIHFGIGKAGRLSAPQVKESHDNQLHMDNIPGDSMTIAVAPYAAMSNGDKVQLVWKGVKKDGTDGPSVPISAYILSDSDTEPGNNPGQVLSWTLYKSNLAALNGGVFRLHYEITYASPDEARQTVSAERSIVVKSPLLEALPAPSVRDLVGTEINPSLFPDGIRVVIPPYPGIRVGDDVLVYGTGSSTDRSKNTIVHLKVDASNIESGKLEVPLAASWLSSNRGKAIDVRYQYARADSAGTGTPLELTVREPMVLPTPTVDKSVVNSNRDELDPMLAYSGAYIVIPADATIGEGDSVTAYFKGFDASGSCEINDPSQSNPTKFKVPATVLPSNFGKTVEVTYSVAGQMADHSLFLFIRELNITSRITCEGVQIGSPATLRLSDIPADGAQLGIGLWPFISTQQKVRLWLTANGMDDRDIITLREVLPDECVNGVAAHLTRADLEGVAVNGYFTLHASVSFDGGYSTHLLNNPLKLKLLA